MRESEGDVGQQLRPWRKWCFCARSEAWLRSSCAYLVAVAPLKRFLNPSQPGWSRLIWTAWELSEGT